VEAHIICGNKFHSRQCGYQWQHREEKTRRRRQVKKAKELGELHPIKAGWNFIIFINLCQKIKILKKKPQQ
jgi:hypothetical protein